jgi:competence ComEA-like helix-hairpin-helix protein
MTTPPKPTRTFWGKAKFAFYEYFYYTKTERRGMTVLASLLVFFLILPRFFSFIFKRPDTDFTAFKEEVTKLNALIPPSIQSSNNANSTASNSFAFNPRTASLETFVQLGISEKTAKTIINYREKGGKFKTPEDLKKIWGLKTADYERLRPFVVLEENTNNNSNYPTSKSTATPIVLTNFDPNTADETQLKQLGLSEKQATMIVHYREKGGKFKKKEDFARIYGLSPEQYQQLEPYIAIATTPILLSPVAITNGVNTNGTPPTYPTTFKPRAPKTYNAIDINTASSEDWQQLPGVGVGFATRIANYRDKLGGFYSIEQVKETYGLPDSTFQKIKPYLKPSSVSHKINVNNASVEDLRKHPYLKFKHADLIINYRTQHGKFKDANDLKKIMALPPDVVEKVKAYLDF